MTYKRRLKKSSQIRLGISFLVLVSVIIVAGRFWLAAKNSQWTGNLDFSWVEFNSGKIEIKTILPEYSKFITWQIPGNTVLLTAYGYGEYQLKNVYALGEIDSRGEEVISQTLQNNLGLPVHSHLTWWDKVRLAWRRQFKVKESQRINLLDEAVLEPAVLADGTQVYKPVYHKIDQLINRETFSQVLSKEDLSLTLVNDQNLGRVIGNHGIEVVSLMNKPEITDKTTIYVKDETVAKSLSVSWLKSLLPEAEVKVGPVSGYWTDLVLELGEDYN